MLNHYSIYKKLSCQVLSHVIKNNISLSESTNIILGAKIFSIETPLLSNPV